MQLTNDAVAVELHARLQQRRQGQFAELALHVVGRLLGQAVDAHQLHGEVVIAAVDQRLLDQPPRCSVQVVGMGRNDIGHRARIEVLVHAVGGEQEQVARCQREVAVVDFQMRVDAQGAAEIAGFGADTHAVILAQLFESAFTQAMDARIADVEQVRAAPLSTSALKVQT